MSSAPDNLDFEEPKYNTSLWAMSLADLLSIVLSIFVLLFAVSSVNKAKSERAMSGVKGAFANLAKNKDVHSLPQQTPTIQSITGAQDPIRQYYADLKKIVKELLAVDEARFIEKGNTMVMYIPAYLLFPPDSASLDDKKLFMGKLADQLTETVANQNIDVEFMAAYIATKDKIGADSTALAIKRAGAFSRSMVALGVKENSIYAGIAEGNPDTITITFFPRDETRSTLVF